MRRSQNREGERHPITPNGYLRLLKKLSELKKKLRELLMNELPEARAISGDRSLNSHYRYLKERQALLESRITELERKIASSEIVVGRRLVTQRVAFGAEVVIENVTTKELSTFRLVGPFESDVGNGELSVGSPLGRSLMGRYVGDEVVVMVPAGKRVFRIVGVTV